MEVIEYKVDPGDKLLIPGDIHVDKEDLPAIRVMVKAAARLGVNRVCFVGDGHESAGISRHPSLRKKVKGGKGTIKSEKRHMKAILNLMESQLKLKSKDVLTGNHEDWWDTVQVDYPAFDDMQWWEVFGDLYDGWTVREEQVALKYGPLLVCHGHRLNGSLAKFAAASILANYPGQNTACGHNHRLDVATTPTFKYGQRVSHGAWTVGHLKRRDIEIKEKKIGQFSEKHQQGFGISTFFSRGGGKLGFDMSLYRIHRDHKDRPMVVLPTGEVIR